MARLLIYLGLACVICKLMTGRWPWVLVGWEPGSLATRSRTEASARTLLGVGRDASRIEILEAHKRLLAIVHPDRGGTNDQVHEANAARDLLLARLPGQRAGS
jgi:DnaJ family protein C protein 19